MTQTIPPFGSVEHFVERFRDHTDRLGNLYTVAFKHVEAVVADPISGDYARLGYIRNVVAAVAQVLDEQPVKPTPLTPEPIAAHYDATDPDAGEESCACGQVVATRELLKRHIAEGNAAGAPECSPACRDLYRPDRGVHFLGCPNFSTPMEVAQAEEQEAGWTIPDAVRATRRDRIASGQCGTLGCPGVPGHEGDCNVPASAE